MSNRQPPRALVPQEYGHRGGAIHGAVPLASLTRFSPLVDPAADGDAVAVDLRFGITGRGHVVMQGRLGCRVRMRCERCLRSVGRDLTADIDVLVVTSELAADALRSDADAHDPDVLVVAEGMVDVVDLIEDDLILALPQHACPDFDGCEFRPRLQWGDPTVVEPAPRQRPFAGPQQMKNVKKPSGAPDDD